MFVLLAVAAAAVVAAVVVVATGRGGELVLFAPGGPRLALPTDRSLDAADVLGMRPPRRLWGYRTDDVDELLQWVAHSLAEHDARIAILEQRLADVYARDRARARAAREQAQDAVRDAEETW